MNVLVPVIPSFLCRRAALIARTAVAVLLFVPLMVGGALLAGGGIGSVPAKAATEYFNDSGIAIRGFDAVSFHTESKPILGSSEFSVDWEGAEWQFSTAKNRDLFAADPTKYAPQYGGWCAYAMARGAKATTDPKNAWSIHRGKLYLNYSSGVKSGWVKEQNTSIPAADSHWVKIRRQILAGS